MADKIVKVKVAPPFELNSTDWSKMGKDALYFALVPVTFYIGQVLGTINEAGHILSMNDFVPQNSTLIAAVSYVFGQALSFIRKYIS